ncbi:hypothetical protein F66182_9131 [Fusarium sp. NRRL 66182]|nr:hypothetical protein F66182_9131 [Fusarium sp. NRRL 66182]
MSPSPTAAYPGRVAAFMNSKNWNDRADKDLFFTILSVKNIGIISGSEWTTIGNHMRSLGYGFTNEGCRQHFQGLRRAQNKTESTGPNGESSRRSDPTMNPITRRPGPGRGRPRKQPPAPLPGVPGEEIPNPVLNPPGPPNPALHHQPVPAYGVPPVEHQHLPPTPAQAALRVVNIHPAPTGHPDDAVPIPSNAVPDQGSVTYPSPPRTTELPQNSPHLHHLQPDQPRQQSQPVQPAQQPQPEHSQLPGQHPQPDQQHPPSVQQLQPSQQSQDDYQPQHVQQEPPREAREASGTSATSQPPPVEPNHEPHSVLTPEQLGQVDEDVDVDVDIDADGDADADAELDVDHDEPNAKRRRLGSPDPAKADDMDDEAVLALAAHNGSTDFASDFATYGEA